jgi:NitT/TauT family transport system substrate-binding protein
MTVQARVTRSAWIAAVAAFASVGVHTRIAAQDLPALRVGCGSREVDAEVYFADVNGFFRNVGLTVDIQQFAAGNIMAAAIASGHLDVADSNLLTVAGAQLRGLPFLYIAPGNVVFSNAPTAMIVAAPNSPIRTAKDLNGKVVSGISLGSVDQVEMLSWIDKNGGDFASVKFIEVPVPEMPAALAQGRIDATVMNDPDLTAAVNAKTVRVIGNATEGVAKQYVGNGWFANTDWIAKNVETVRKFQAAMTQAADWANANPDKAAVILSKVTKIQEPRIRARFARKLDPPAMQPLLDAAYKYKMFPRPMNATAICWDGR